VDEPCGHGSRRGLNGTELGAWLAQVGAGDPIAARVDAVELGRERAFRARLVVGAGRVPRSAEAEMLRWLQLARWTPRLEVETGPAELREPGRSIDALWREAEASCREVDEPLQRVGGALTVLVADLDRMTEQVGTWPAEVGPILRFVDGVRPVVGVAAKAPFAPNVTLRILARLVAGGVLMVGSREPEGRDPVVSPEPLED
jgi:hypothetical protein